MQQILSEIRSKIQNYSYNFNNVQAISDISVASYFTRCQKFWIFSGWQFLSNKEQYLLVVKILSAKKNGMEVQKQIIFNKYV